MALITRRGVIAGLIAAPAIVKIDSLMKLSVPKKVIWLRPGIYFGGYDVSVVIPQIRNVMPDLIAQQIIGAQDMTQAARAFGELYDLTKEGKVICFNADRSSLDSVLSSVPLPSSKLVT